MEDQQAIIRRYKDDPRTTGGRDRLWGHIRKDHPDISRRDVAKFLKEDSVHQIHRPLKKRQTTRRIRISAPATVAQIDLIDFQKLAGSNGGTRYLLTYVDLFSKYVAVRRMPNKKQDTLVEKLGDILASLPKDWRPRTIQADNGGEFGSKMEAALAADGIKTIHSAAYRPTTQGAIERYNRTLKSDLYQMMKRHGTNKYIDFIEPLVENINQSKHGTTGETPLEVMREIPLSEARLQQIRDRMESKIKPQQAETFSVGQLVRVALTTESAIRKQTFRKKITNNWSPTVFEIYSISEPTSVGTLPQYLLENLTTKRKSKKKYWAYQLLDAHSAEVAPEPEEPESEPEEDEPEPEQEPQPQPVRRSARAWVPSQEGLRHFASRS